MPVDLGAVVVAYNAFTNGSGPLRLTGPVIARIFLGQITKWDDPAIKALNPGTELPDAYINVVHRSDGSGTTYIFSNYLSSVSPAWAAAVGTGRSLRWPVGIGADGNAGVAAQIGRIPYSIGYTGRSYVTGFSIVNEPGPASYPISGYSWVLLPRPPAKPGRRRGAHRPGLAQVACIRACGARHLASSGPSRIGWKKISELKSYALQSFRLLTP